MKHLIYIIISLLILSCKKKVEQPPKPVFDEVAEKAAIMKTIEAETEAFYRRDYDAWKDHFVHTDYAYQTWNNPDGTFTAKVGWPTIDQGTIKFFSENKVPEGGSSHPKVERRNMIVHFYGDNVAYMIWDQYNLDHTLKKYTHSKDSRIMEKVDGQWKIANVSAFWDYKNLIAVDSLK